jgi:F420-0:gamma-glutamyl ligase
LFDEPFRLCGTAFCIVVKTNPRYIMEIIPIRTRLLQPPKDDLYDALHRDLLKLKSGDILVLTSKIVSIHQGRCVNSEGCDNEALIYSEADMMFKFPHRASYLTVKYDAFLHAAGIDESNGGGYSILLPERPFETALEIWSRIRAVYGVGDLGVIIIDSHLLPFRKGSLGISLGFWGFHPVFDYSDKHDLFGNKYNKRLNIVDSLATAATLVMGEGNERTPACIFRDVPRVGFANASTADQILMEPRADFFYPLLKLMEKRYGTKIK